MNESLPKLLRAIASGTKAKENKHDIILNAAADEIEQLRAALRLTQPAEEVIALLFRCTECGWLGNDSEIITFDDPERVNNSWNICPQCRSAEQFENVCDEPGCTEIATCGWPSDKGYRRTCYGHSSFAHAKPSPG